MGSSNIVSVSIKAALVVDSSDIPDVSGDTDNAALSFQWLVSWEREREAMDSVWLGKLELLGFQETPPLTFVC